MADSPLNLLDAADRAAPGAPGDLPERLRRLYLAERQGSSAITYFVDATAVAAAFRDEGRRLATDRNDPNVIRDLVAIARHRGWTAVDVRGQTDFRREAWLTARASGLEVRGYRPTERDEQELARRLSRQTGRTRRTDRERGPAPPSAERGEASRRTRLRVVESVVRNRVDDPADQARILSKARERLARELERGAGSGGGREQTR